MPGMVRIRTLVKFVNLCLFTQRRLRYPTVEEIMQRNNCCKSNAYNYLRALEHLYPQRVLDLVRAQREDTAVQQTLIQPAAQ